MINHIKGKLIEKTPTYAVIECGGVGYYLHISLNTYSKLSGDENAMLYAHLAVREDAHTLYGFFDKDEQISYIEDLEIIKENGGIGVPKLVKELLDNA